jgi:hypothetical protein
MGSIWGAPSRERYHTDDILFHYNADTLYTVELHPCRIRYNVQKNQQDGTNNCDVAQAMARFSVAWD